MGHMPTLISDLALILSVAGLMTLLCKKLNQPSILGYILAGVLIGPVVQFLPTVADTANITVWADIGVIFLMFGLGLEFSVHKMGEVGMAGFITATIKILGVGLTGFACGQIMGMGLMNSIFLGGMLSMSSTMVCLKAIDDMNLRKMPFVSLITGVLVIEDIAAIFLMIILSTVAVSQSISGLELAVSLGQMFLYLIIWLVLGIYILPSFLKRVKDLMNEEMLLVVSLGICFAMTWLANALGFSTALGAFLAGSILAGTVHAEHIEHLIKPCKDLFGAVFFVSVGLLVDPAVMIEYSGTIIILTIVTVISIFSFLVLGMLISGQSLHDSIYAATTQTQIGEFSFIIASLGLTLGVTSDFLYPVIVAVSVLTTFVTPFLVRLAPKMIAFADKALPDKVQKKLAEFQASKQNTRPANDSDWRKFLQGYFKNLLLYGAIAVGLILLVDKMVAPKIYALGYFEEHIGSYVLGAVLFILLLLIVSPLVRVRSSYFTALWLKNRANRIPLLLLVILRYCVACGILLLPGIMYWHIPPIGFVLVIVPAIYLAAHSDRLSGQYLKIEANFLANFNERQLIENFTESGSHSWLDEQLYVWRIKVNEESEIAGKSLIELNWGNVWHVKVIRIVHGKKISNIPQGDATIAGGDTLCVLAEQKVLDNFALFGQNGNKFTTIGEKETLRHFISTQEDLPAEHQILCCALKVQKDSALNGCNIKESPIKNEWFGFLIGIERNLYPIVDPSSNMILQHDDLLWLLGTQKMGTALAREQLL